MAPSRRLPAFLLAQADLAKGILGHLSLRDLASLQASCRALRSLVVPEPLWQVR